MKKSVQLLISFVSLLLISFILFYFLYQFPEVMSSWSKKIFGEKENYNGILLESIIKVITLITVVFGVFFGYHQLENAVDNNIHEKYKTALALLKGPESETILCGILMLHKVALKSKGYRSSIRAIMFGLLVKTKIELAMRDKYKSLVLLNSKKNIYRSPDVQAIENSIFRDFSLEKMYFENIKFIECDFINLSFISCNFNNVTFQKCNFENSLFRKAKFNKCTFSKSTIKYISNNSCDFTNSIFTTFTFDETVFNSVTMDNIKFIKGHIKNCNFLVGSFLNSNFFKTSISNCKFPNIDFSGVTYFNSRIELSDLSKSLGVNPHLINDARSIFKSTFSSNIENLITLDRNKQYLTGDRVQRKLFIKYMFFKQIKYFKNIRLRLRK